MALDPREIGITPSTASITDAPDWESGRYLNFAGRTVKHSDIVNMTNMDVARNSTMLSFAKIAGPVLRAIPTPATQAIGWVTTVASYGYDTLKLVSRMSENKSNDAFWSEYNEAVKSVNAQEGMERIATDFAIGSNLASGQSLPANVKPIGEIAGGLGKMAQYVALGVLGGTKTFIFGGAISNAMNDANTRMGYGEEQGAAIAAGIARGVASGLTAAAFLSAWPRAVERLGGWMVDKGTGLGFVASPVTNAGLRAIEFGGWGMAEPYVLNLTRDVAGLDPLPHEDDPIATAGMFALGAMMSGGLLKKSYSFTGPRRLPSTGEKEYLNFAEMAAGKKSALKAVNETVGSRNWLSLSYDDVADFSGNLKLNKAIEERILEQYGVSKKLLTPQALEKVGGPEAALRLTTGDEQAIERAMSELSTANRLIKQAKEYDLSAQSFTAERTGGKVTDTFIPDAEGVARKVRIVDKKDDYISIYHRTNTPVENIYKEGFKPLENTDEVYFSSVKNGQAVGYGPNVVELKVRKKDLRIDDEFDTGEQHFAMTKNQANKYLKKSENIPDHIKKSVGLGSAAIVSGLIYTNLGNDQWDIKETQWLTPAVASRLAEMARNEYRISRDRQGSITKAMNVLTDDYALNPDNYKMVYDRFMKLTGGYA